MTANNTEQQVAEFKKFMTPLVENGTINMDALMVIFFSYATSSERDAWQLCVAELMQIIAAKGK